MAITMRMPAAAAGSEANSALLSHRVSRALGPDVPGHDNGCVDHGVDDPNVVLAAAAVDHIGKVGPGARLHVPVPDTTSASELLSDSSGSSSDSDIDGLECLVDDLRRILGPSSGLDSADVDVDHIMEAMEKYNQRNEDEWDRYALADPSRAYTRNGVDDINRKANLMVLVWNPGKGSMIHDHANAHCVVKILKGKLTETRYDWPEGHEGAAAAADNDAELEFEPHSMHPRKVSTYCAGQVTYMSDQLGLHRMSNPSTEDVAVSLHLYTPPYAAKFGCHIYDERSGKSHKVDVSTLYSDKGILTPKPVCTSG